MFSSIHLKTKLLFVRTDGFDEFLSKLYIGHIIWLFVGSERAGQRAAAIETLLGTAQLNGLNSAAWLKETLDKLPAWPNSRIDELLPLAPEFIEAFKLEKS